LNVVLTGVATKDPFVDYNGFIIFVKGMPHPIVAGKEVCIKVNSIKPTFAFAQYVNKKKH
jgi:predicted RNA-binding protein with TRAM domain